MRLLERKTDDEFVMTEFWGSNLPPYAILSHTWGTNGEEVTFRDLENGTGKQKSGYEKLKFCGRQAANDNLQFFWVDTCCIDKSSSAELSEAINSMFRWYQNSNRCYVYLTDVSTAGVVTINPASQALWESSFHASRWHTRGWTLQEIVAPSSVEFFSREGRRLGDKISLEVQIHQTTGIPITALRGENLSTFSVAERMTWASNRKTTREEDKAYCLLGIFDVFMPLIYGEGKRAFARLEREIKESSKPGLLSAPQIHTPVVNQTPTSSAVPAPPNLAAVFALYDFSPIEDGELKLVKGEFVFDIDRKLDKNWWMGTNQKGERGMFPHNYVALPPTTAKALFTFEATEVNDLGFRKDDIITHIEITEHKWWSGNCNGKVGLFPSNYVQLGNITQGPIN